MHELSIASNIVEFVTQAAAGRRVRRVTLEIGRLSGVSPDAPPSVFRNQRARALLVSAKTGEGFGAWLNWIRAQSEHARQIAAP